MTCPNQSLVKMEPKEVIRIAEEYLAYAKEQKETWYKTYLDASRNYLTKNMNAWYRLWWKRNPTEAEVWNNFSDDNKWGYIFSMKYRVDARYAVGEEIAKKLIKACSVAKDEIYVSVEDVSEIT
jgi:hypothetical protein